LLRCPSPTIIQRFLSQFDLVYQLIGVKDIVVLDPRTGKVRHWQQGQTLRTYASPAPLIFLCGCSAVV
jgi:hypothetical protein